MAAREADRMDDRLQRLRRGREFEGRVKADWEATAEGAGSSGVDAIDLSGYYDVITRWST